MTPDYEHPVADPAMVLRLMQAISGSIERTSIPEVTTTADILSALFTTLDHALRVAAADSDPEDAEYNANEISRVLMEMLVEFGDVKKQ